MPPEIEKQEEGKVELPAEIEIGGQKYNPSELLEAQKNWKAHENDIKELPALKQDREALGAIQQVINADPEVATKIRTGYGKLLAGLPLTPSESAAVEKVEAAKPGIKPGTKPEEGQFQVPQDILDRLEANEQRTASVLTAESQRIFKENLTAFQTKFPAFKDEAKLKELYDAGKNLAVAKMSELVSMGEDAQRAWGMAQSWVSNMSHEQIMMNTPMRKYFEEEILAKAGGRPGLPGGIGTGAERLQDGRPGPTPELDTQLRNKIKAAGMDTEKRMAAIEEWATQTGRHPLELYGFDPATARAMAPV